MPDRITQGKLKKGTESISIEEILFYHFGQKCRNENSNPSYEIANKYIKPIMKKAIITGKYKVNVYDENFSKEENDKRKQQVRQFLELIGLKDWNGVIKK